MNEGYGDFARLYDEALGSHFAEKIEPFLESILTRYAVPRPFHLDLASGTSATTPFFASKGFRTVSLDASIQMLVAAKARATLRTLGDMCSLPLAESQFGLVSCLYDSFNHLLTEAELRGSLADVERVLVDSGLFVFDVNHPRAYERVWGGDEPFEQSGDGWRMRISTESPGSDGLAVATVEGVFQTSEGDRYEFTEVRRQRSWEPAMIETVLVEVGLRLEEAFEFDPFNQLEGEVGGTKVMIVARKSPRHN